MAWIDSPTVADALRTQALGDRIVELWRIEVDSTPTFTPTLCVVHHETDLEFDGETYHPFEVNRGPVQLSGDGSVPRASISLSNVSREMALQVEAGAGFIDQSVRWSVGLLSHLADPTAFGVVEWTVTGAALDADSLVLQLEGPAVNGLEVPRRIFQRHRCSAAFRSDACGYEPDPTLGANYQTCGKLLTDCIARGDDEVDRGLPRMHPLMFNAWPGIPRRVRGAFSA